MRGINRVTIAGHLGADPEQRQFTNGSVTYFSVATSEKWADKQTGEAKEATEWHRIVCFGKLSDVAIKYLRKGSKIYVEGSLRTRKWQDQNNQDRYTTEVRADRLEFLDDNPNTNNNAYTGNNQQNYNAQNGNNPNQQQNNQNFGNNHPNQPSQDQMPPPKSSGGGDVDEDIPFAPFFGG